MRKQVLKRVARALCRLRRLTYRVIVLLEDAEYRVQIARIRLIVRR